MAQIVYGPLFSQGREKLIERCVNQMDAAEVRFAYLVPTSQLQREVQLGLMERLKQGRPTLACLEPQVYLFHGFVSELLKDALAYQPPIRADQQKLILRDVAKTLKETGKLPLFSDLVEYDGFYLSLQQWLTEVKRMGITPEGWCGQAGSDKEGELGLIYAGYEEFLDRHELVDQERNYTTAIQLLTEGASELERGAFARLELVMIDGFYTLHPLQLRLLEALLAWGKEIVVHTFFEEERQDLFLSTQEMIQAIKGLTVHGGEWTVEGEPPREMERPEALQWLCTELFQLTVEPRPCDPSVEILYTPDPYQEIEAIGREIKQMLLTEGSALRLGDIGVVLRNVEAYHFYIAEVFRELGLPYEISMGTPLVRTPIFRLVMKLYRIFAEDWSRESVLEVLKSSYLTVAGDEQVERWEEWILEAGIIGGEAEWMRKLDRLQARWMREEEKLGTTDREMSAEELLSDSLSGDGDERLKRRLTRLQDESRQKREELARMQDSLREFFGQLKRLNSTQSLFDHSKALLEFLRIYRLDQQVVKTRDFLLLRRDVLSLHQLQQLLTERIHFGELFQTSPGKALLLKPLEFMQDLQAGAQLSVLVEPEAKLDAVQILTPSQSRGCRFKRVFIGGLLEGEFPWYGQRDWLLKPDERKAWKERGFPFQQAIEQRGEERLFFLEAACTAAEKLILTCPALPDQESGRSSSFLREVQNLFHEETIPQRTVVMERVQRDHARLQQALTRRELDENMLRELWESGSHLHLSLFSEVAVTRMNDPGDSLSRFHDLFLRGEMVQSREGASFSRYDGVLEEPAIRTGLAQTFHPERVYSISQINEYAICPFQFFCKRIIHLDRVEEPTLRLEPLELGNIYHQILYQFFNAFPGWSEESVEAAMVRLQTIAAEILTDHPASFALPAGLWAAYCGEILEHLERMLDFEYEEASRQGFLLQPYLLEASFGLQKELQEKGTRNHPEPVIIERTIDEDPKGTITVRFSGKMDRIDRSTDGRYLVIYDYKFGRRDGLDDMEAGIDLQLPIYVKAAKLLCGGEAQVLGAGYFSILKCDRKSGIWRDLEPTLVPVTGRSKNCLREEEWDRLLAQADAFVIDYIQRIRSGDFRVDPMKCPKYCKFNTICRFEHARHRRKIHPGREENPEARVKTEIEVNSL